MKWIKSDLIRVDIPEAPSHIEATINSQIMKPKMKAGEIYFLKIER